MDVPSIDIPPVGEGLVHLGRPVCGALRRLLTLRSLGLDDALRLRCGDALIVQLTILR
jgi:hypothetical protein